jgi:hypothetical protein
LARVVIAAAEYRLHEIRNGWRHWLIAPALFAGTTALLLFNVPLRLGVAVSRPAMDRLAREVLSAPPGTTHPDRRVGIYYAKGIETLPRGGMRFRVAGTSFIFSEWGFAYTPWAGRPAQVDPSIDHYSAIGDDGWHVWNENW